MRADALSMLIIVMFLEGAQRRISKQRFKGSWDYQDRKHIPAVIDCQGKKCLAEITCLPEIHVDRSLIHKHYLLLFLMVWHRIRLIIHLRLIFLLDEKKSRVTKKSTTQKQSKKRNVPWFCLQTLCLIWEHIQMPWLE